MKTALVTVCFFVLISTTTGIFKQLGPAVPATTVAFSFLIIIVFCSVFARPWHATTLSFIAAFAFNYFFRAGGTRRYSAVDVNTWLTFLIFALTAMILSRLSTSARTSAQEAEKWERMMLNLKDFGTRMLALTQERMSLSAIAQEAVRIFNLEYCAVHIYREGKSHLLSGSAFSESFREFDHSLRKDEDHPTTLLELADENDLGVRYARILKGDQDVAVLVLKSDDLSTSAIGAIAYMIGIRLMQILEDTEPFTVKVTG